MSAAGIPLLLILPSICGAQEATTTGHLHLEVDPATLRSISFRWFIEGDADEDAVGTLKYLRVGEALWNDSLPLSRVSPNIVDEGQEGHRIADLFAGSAFFLEPDTTCEAELAIEDRDGVKGVATQTLTVKTRAEPACSDPILVCHLYPPDWQGEKEFSAYSVLQAAVDGLLAGKLLLVFPGTHLGGAELKTSGTAERPICIRGAGGGESILVLPAGPEANQHSNLTLSYREDTDAAIEHADIIVPRLDPNERCFAIDFYNNDIYNARDDLIEVDECSHNVRVVHNQLYNGHAGINIDPGMGGPLYVIRNEIYNVTSTSLKLQSAPSGVLALNNTLVGANKSLLASSHEMQNATFRKNLFLGHDDQMVMEAGSKRKIEFGPIPTPDNRDPDLRTTLDYNG